MPTEKPTPGEVVQEALQNLTDPDTLNALIAPDAVYVSLNFENPELKRIMPWTGTNHGSASFSKALGEMFSYWEMVSFDATDFLEDDGKVAVFGRFTYRSLSVDTTVTSPFAILAKVDDGLITYLQFMEDTYATASSFRSGGAWVIHNDPNGTPFEL
jgi:uncharacterized protein